MEMLQNKKVSIIIPTYRRPDTLCRTIDSINNSTYKNVEIIVVDDNNPGDEGRKLTEKVMEPLVEKYSCIHYIKHPQNRNGSAARNTGIL